MKAATGAICGLVVLIGVSPGSAQAQGGGSDPAASQKALDRIASLPLPSTSPEPGALYLPEGSFRSWTQDQQRAVPGRISQFCLLSWIVVRQGVGKRLLPPEFADSEALDLGFDLCVAGHMPSDWPTRGVYLQGAKAILADVNKAGSPLHLPSSLKP